MLIGCAKRLLLLLLLATAAYGQSLYRYENILLNQNGTPLTGVNTYVCTGQVTPTFSSIPPCTLATVYSDLAGSISITQPITTSPLGNYSFVAKPGVYTGVFIGPGVQSSDLITIPIVSSLSTVTVDGSIVTSLAAALTACPAAGCVIDMRGNYGVTSLGTFDPGSKAVTLLLGPYAYTATQITLRSGLRIIGSNRGATTVNGTSIQATSTSLPLFVGPGPTQSPAVDVWLQGFALYGPVLAASCANAVNSNNTDAFQIDSSASTTGQGGLWYSQFYDIQICNFGGAGLHFKGATGAGGTNGVNQFNSFFNVTALRSQGGGSALRLEGANYQFFFSNVQFDSSYGNGGLDVSATPNIFIGGGPTAGTTGYPFIIQFTGLTSQGAATICQIDGGRNITFQKAHHEVSNGVYSITFGANGASVPTYNVVVSDSSFNGNTATNSGNGFLLKNASANTIGITFNNNLYGSPASAVPDHVVQDTSGTVVVTSVGTSIIDTAGTTTYVYPMTISNLPSAAVNTGLHILVTDSTSIAAEGQTCTHTAASPVNAIAISNGSIWKCF